MVKIHENLKRDIKRGESENEKGNIENGGKSNRQKRMRKLKGEREKVVGCCFGCRKKKSFSLR